MSPHLIHFKLTACLPACLPECPTNQVLVSELSKLRDSHEHHALTSDASVTSERKGAVLALERMRAELIACEEK